MTGMETAAATRLTHSSAIGKMAGPLIPPNPPAIPSRGRPVAISTAHGNQAIRLFQQLCPPSALGTPGPGGNVPLSPAQCFARHGYTQWTTYQPASRFWPVQFIEAGWLLALSVLLIAATIWLARRRAA
jgi:hypothetical protein